MTTLFGDAHKFKQHPINIELKIHKGNNWGIRKKTLDSKQNINPAKAYAE